MADKKKEKPRCRGCNQEISWVRNETGSTPFNLDGTNHFTTCPKRDQFKRRPDHTLREVSDSVALLKANGYLLPRLYEMKISEIMDAAKEINAKETEVLW